MSAKLVFQGGSSSTAEVDLGDGELTIGREPGCDLVLSGEVVSRQQTSVQFEDGLYVLKDLGSTNGTFVNRRKVHEQVLRDGDVIEFGLGGPEARFQQESAAGIGKTVLVSRKDLGLSDPEIHCSHCGAGLSVPEMVSLDDGEYVSVDPASIPAFCPNCGTQIDTADMGDLLGGPPRVLADVGGAGAVDDGSITPVDEASGAYDSSAPDPGPGRRPGTITAWYHEARDIVLAEGGRPATGMVMKEFVRLAYAKSRRRTRLVAFFALLLTVGISSAVYLRGRAETERVQRESEAAFRGLESPDDEGAAEDGVASTPRGDGKDIALLIGVDHYRDDWGDLRNPSIDASAIGGVLEKLYGFEVHLMENPTQLEVMDSVTHYSHLEYSPRDQLLIFMAGHGSFDEQSRMGYFIASDTEAIKDDPHRQTAIHYTWLREFLSTATAKHVLLILDACYGGAFDKKITEATHRGEEGPYPKADVARYVSEIMPRATRRYLTLGGKERVPDGDAKHSPFAFALLETLRRGGGEKGLLTLSGLFADLESVLPLPRAGNFLGDDAGSDFVFVAKPPDP